MALSLDTAERLARLFLAGPATDTPGVRRVQLDQLMRDLSRLPEEELPNLLVRLAVPFTRGQRRLSYQSMLRRWLDKQAKEVENGMRGMPGAAGAAPEDVGQ